MAVVGQGSCAIVWLELCNGYALTCRAFSMRGKGGRGSDLSACLQEAMDTLSHLPSLPVATKSDSSSSYSLASLGSSTDTISMVSFSSNLPAGELYHAKQRKDHEALQLLEAVVTLCR